MTTTTKEMQNSMMPWWLALIEGIALVILGALFLTNTAATTLVFIQVVGIYWLIRGILYIIHIFIDSSMWGWKLFAGIVGILAGVWILNHPLISPFMVGAVLVIVLGVQGLILGIVGLIQAFQGAGWGAGILAVISIIIGVWLLANIGAATLAIPWAIGLLAVIGGIAVIIAAFKLK